MPKNTLAGMIGWKQSLFDIIRGFGWKGWLGIGGLAGVILIALVGIFRFSRADREASALVSRDAALFIETRNLGEALTGIAMWPLWLDNRRSGGDEQWNQMHTALSSLITGKQPAIGSTQPRIWLANSRRAALAFPRGGQGWVALLEIPSPGHAITELRRELNLSVTQGDPDNPGDIARLSSGSGIPLFVRAFGPWLMLSPAREQLEFADTIAAEPGMALARAGVLPEWRGETAFRGMVDPAYVSSMAGLDNPLVKASSWLSPEGRMAFAGRLDREGVLEMRAAGAFRSEAAPSNPLWSILKWGFLLLLTACFLIVITALALMLGIGGWFKLRALNAGIGRRSGPADPAPSPAFVADSGGGAAPDRAADAETGAMPQSGATANGSDETFSTGVPAEDVAPGVEPAPSGEPGEAARVPTPKRRRAPRRRPEVEADATGETGSEAAVKSKKGAYPRRPVRNE